jgi:DNA-binding MarR family transcriptional regulator
MRRFLSFSEVALAEAGVTSHQYQVLLVVRTVPDRRIKLRDLAEQMLMQHNSAVQLVDRMCSAGLTERIPAIDDKRSVLIAMTTKGENVLEALAKIHVEAMLENEPLLAESLSRLRHVTELA